MLEADFSKYIKKDGGKKHLDPPKPLFTNIKPEKLSNMTAPEIKKLWKGLSPDVHFSFSAFFNDKQLQALADHPDKEISRDAMNALDA